MIRALISSSLHSKQRISPFRVSAKYTTTGRQRKEKTKLNTTSWIDKLFRDELANQSLPVADLKLLDGRSCTIENPQLTMQNEYLGGHLIDCIDAINEAAVISPNPRSKPLVVTVRGTGGGKTRLLEELRLNVNKATDNVALSITFNNRMPYDVKSEIFIEDANMLRVNIVLSILLRFAATAYDISYGNLIMYIKDQIGNMDVSTLAVEENLVLFSRHFLSRIIHDIDATIRQESSSVCLRNFFCLSTK